MNNIVISFPDWSISSGGRRIVPSLFILSAFGVDPSGRNLQKLYLCAACSALGVLKEADYLQATKKYF